MIKSPVRHPRGFSLLEAVVATMVLTLTILSVSRLLLLSMQANQSATALTVATLLADQKMEQLRSMAWNIDQSGLPVTDASTDVTTLPERATGGSGLSPSPPGSLQQNTSGYCDFVDGQGVSLGGGSAPPVGTAFIRRWSIEPLALHPDAVLVVQVLVVPRSSVGTDALSSGGSVRRVVNEVRLVTVRTRKAT